MKACQLRVTGDASAGRDPNGADSIPRRSCAQIQRTFCIHVATTDYLEVEHAQELATEDR